MDNKTTTTTRTRTLSVYILYCILLFASYKQITSPTQSVQNKTPFTVPHSQYQQTSAHSEHTQTISNQGNKRCYMYRAKVHGGLGNRLWQILSTTGLAKKHSCSLVFFKPHLKMVEDTFDYDTLRQSLYHFNSSTNLQIPNGAKIFHPPNGQDNKILKLPPENERNTSVHVEVRGFLQNYRYSAASPEEFGKLARRSLVFKPEIAQQANETLYNMARCPDGSDVVVKKFIGLHYRRFPEGHEIEVPINKTMELMQKLLDVCNHQEGDHEAVHCNENLQLLPCCALIISNDPDFSKQAFQNLSCARFVDNEFIPEESKQRDNLLRRNGWASDFGRDMCLLAKVDILVTTIGTFGYFGGLLHDGTRRVYAYRQSYMSALQPNYWFIWG